MKAHTPGSCSQSLIAFPALLVQKNKLSITGGYSCFKVTAAAGVFVLDLKIITESRCFESKYFK